MFWFKDKKKTETFTPQQIHFLCEQNGAPERDLKEALCKYFTDNSFINRAYLARVKYSQAESSSVALCINSSLKSEYEKQLAAKELGKIFKSIFNKDAYMDILYLREDQEVVLRQVCSPFYSLQSQKTG